MSTRERAAERGIELRRTFVGMLFALAIARVAELTVHAFSIVRHGWDVSIGFIPLIERLALDGGRMLAPFFHLALGALLIATSWVGWSRSTASGNQRPVRRIISCGFLLLLLDVVLVVLYFTLVTSVELDVTAVQAMVPGQLDLASAIPAPSAGPEALWLAAVFLVYVMWDVVADVLMDPIEGPCPRRPRLSRLLGFVTGVFTYASVSVVCVLLALWLHSHVQGVQDVRVAILGDVALIALVFLFRTLKWSERLWLCCFSWERERDGAKRAEHNPRRAFLEIVFPAAIFAGMLSLINFRDSLS